MGWKEKYFYSEAGIFNLLFGLTCIFIAFGLIIFAYGWILGQPIGDLSINDLTNEEFVSTMVLIWIGILFFGVIGGYELGRYIQTEFNKRKFSTNP